MSNKSAVTAVGVIAALTVALAGCGGGDTAQPAAPRDDATSELYEAAQEEGEVLVYMNLVPDIVAELKSGFEAKYPGVTAEIVRLSDTEMLPRLDSEIAAGGMEPDSITTASPQWLSQQSEGTFAAADESPQATGQGGYDAETYFDAEHDIYQIGAVPFTFAWNTDLVPDGIEDYPDLIGAAEDGRIGVVELVAPIANDYYVWLEDTFGTEFYEALGAENPRIYTGAAPSLESLISGETAVTIWGQPSLIEDAKAQGAPVDYAISPEGAFPLYVYAANNAEAKHPAAAQLWLDYLLTEEGQAAAFPFASSVLKPAPDGVLLSNDELPPLPDFAQSSAENLETARARWDATFR